MDYSTALGNLMQEAEKDIIRTLQKRNEIILFEPGALTGDALAYLLLDYPDIAVYARFDMAEWAAVQTIRMDTRGVIILDCIHKGDHFGERVSVNLQDLSAQDMIELAAFIAG